MTLKRTRQIMFNVWFHSWLCIIFQPYSQYTDVYLIYVVSHYFESSAKLLKSSIFHTMYAYFRVLFLACDGRRQGDPNVPSVRQKKARWSEWALRQSWMFFPSSAGKPREMRLVLSMKWIYHITYVIIELNRKTF